MAKQKSVSEIKHGSVVLSHVFTGVVFFNDLVRATGLDKKVLQKTLAALQKNAYIAKNTNGQWITLETENDEVDSGETAACSGASTCGACCTDCSPRTAAA